MTETTLRPEVSVVLPCHNEADSLRSLIPEIIAVLGNLGLRYEIVVADDGSTDDTHRLTTNLSRDHAFLRHVEHQHRRGQSAALLTGVAAARAGWVITLDGDGQNDPADIPRVWGEALNHLPDRPLLVTGHRTARKDGGRRLILSRVLNAWSAAMLGHQLMDKSCGLKVFRRDAYLALPVFDHMHRFLPGLFRVIDGEVRSVPVGHRPRTQGQSHYTNPRRLVEGIVDVLGIVWLRRRYLPPAWTDHEPA